MRFSLFAFICIVLFGANAVFAQRDKPLENHYQVLGVNPSVNAKELRQAYHKKSLEWHPDKNKGSKDAEKMFIKVQEAYEVLKDPQRRSAFDAAWRYSQRRAGSGGQRTEGSQRPSGEQASTDMEEGFSFNWNGTNMSFDELMEMMRQWEKQSSTLRTAKSAFKGFMYTMTDQKMRYYLDTFLPIYATDSMSTAMGKRFARWIAWSARGLLRSLLYRIEARDARAQA